MGKKSMERDPIMEEVRRIREAVSREHSKNPRKFSDDSKKLVKDLGMKYAKIHPVAGSLKELLQRKKKDPAA